MPRKKKEETVAAETVTKAAKEVKKPARTTRKKAADAVPVAEKVKEVKEAVKEVVKEVSEATAEKAAAVKPVRASRKKAAAAPKVSIQSVMGGEITVDEIISRVKEAAGKEAEAALEIYVKTEENKAYYVAGDVTGSVDLW